MLMGVGLVVTAVGAFGLVSSGGAGTATASPTPNLPTSAPSPSPTVAPSSPPAATPTPDPDALVRAFLTNLVLQVKAGTQASLLDALDPAVVARYGADACRTQLGSIPADPDYAIVVNTVSTAAPWDYASDGKTTTIPDALAIDATVTVGGVKGASPSSSTRTLHLHLVDGVVRWFTDCGTPLP